MQGYVTVALDKQKYVDMAVNLARSIRYFDPGRPVCLIYNEKVSLPQGDDAVFTDKVLLPADPDYVGCTNKIRLYDVSPYDESMYIDADCLLAKADIDRHWRAASKSYFGMTGDKCTSGVWNDMSIEKTCRDFNIPYVVRMNSGVFYFRKCPESKAFFDRLDVLYRNHRDDLSNIHQGRAGQYADEPLFGTAMGEFRIDPVDGGPSEGSWMVTTWRARRCRMDPAAGVSYLEKPSRFFIRAPLFPHGWVKHSPTIFHFIGLKPESVYAGASHFFKDALRAGKACQPG
ncbi:MAG: hypothetical protein F8N37_22030 [Telmatospirillum sp.]|nr:hypothetical protein [Telmatospirillum sp.]